MPKTCYFCKNNTHEVGDYILCHNCTLKQCKGNLRYCKSGKNCVNQRPTVTSRKWMQAGKANYRVKQNGALEFHHYCHACYYQWHYKIQEFDQLVEKNTKLQTQLDQQAEIIAWQRFRLDQLERNFELQHTFADLFNAELDANCKYELFTFE